MMLSSWSWPSREVACQLAANFKATGTAGANIDLLYINPSHHSELLNCIVQSDLKRFESVLSSSLALSLRLDGSVDRMQKHNVYVLIHVITDVGEVKTFFLGFDIPVGNSALSYQKVTQNIVDEVLPWESLLSMTTSLVTDGERKNTGHLTGLWQRLKEEKEEISEGPFITIWCVGHRVNLGWKSTCQLPIISDVIRKIINVSSYFHQSGEKTRLLDAIATEKNLNTPLHYPKYFEIRWSEFTHNLLYVFLRNWNAMMWHFKSAKETHFENLWLSRDRIRLVAFLCDVLTVLKTFQKTFQSSTISILHLSPKKIKLMEDLTSIKNKQLENGWEELLLKQTVTATDGCISLVDHKLISNDRLRSAPFMFTTENRNEIIDSLITNLNEYFDVDATVQNGLAPLLELDPSATYDSLNICHSIIIPEMEFDVFRIEYYEAANLLNIKDRKDSLQSVLKLEQTSTKRFKVLKSALARAYAIKPHSADVENIINVYNKYKDVDRQLLSKKTLFNNIYVHTNMCTLIEFDPTPAAEYWLNQKDRKPRYGTKSTQQEWYSGVFPEAKHYDRPNSRKIQF
ncbi:uncharacterized protein LOC119083454 [Bradysia coprophila]|uniref:uncharacterized protein LOC119083454 n=1 Tax=Bradysia coprophila TaxID=38358 RepID=UPI00187D88E4|nr:uncharacterized protein LOC119083454 [Bradysia coprophila]